MRYQVSSSPILSTNLAFPFPLYPRSYLKFARDGEALESALSWAWCCSGQRTRPILSARIDRNSVPYEPAAVEAIYYAVNNGASVITASWTFAGTDSAHQALKDAVNYAWSRNVMVVAAVPNRAESNFNNFVPARWYNVVSVGGTTSADKKASFSSYGNPGIDVSAPADNIYSTTRTGGYAYGDGNSFAVPLVAGAIALMKKRYPSITSQQIKDRLWNTADKVGGYNYTSNPFCGGHSPQLGCGRLDAADAVR